MTTELATLPQPDAKLSTVRPELGSPAFVSSIDKLAPAIYASGMFGTKNIQQAQIVAASMIAENISPLEWQRRYHLIDGKVTMRADDMLASFHRMGGESEQIERSPDRCCVRLKRNKKVAEFSFTWEEAQAEKYCFNKDGKTLKDNWFTPRRRMQMLWARVVSDGVRAVCPEVNSGTYTPEEMGDDAGKVIEAEYSVPQAVSLPTPPPSTTESPAAAVSESKPEPAATAAEPAATEPLATKDTLIGIKAIKDQLGPSFDAAYKAAVAKFGKASARELTEAEAKRLADWMMKKLAEAQPQNPFVTVDHWGKGPPQEQPSQNPINAWANQT